MFRVTLMVLLLTGCAAPPSAPTPSSPSGAAVQGAEQTHGDPVFLENSDPLDGAMLLAHGVRNRLANGELVSWLPARAAYPFDVDGKTTAEDREALERVLAGRVAEWALQTQGQSRCDALSHRDILSGTKPFHFLDRMGARPPVEAIVRDLTRMGVSPEDIVVNCYTPETKEAGYTVIATPAERELRLKSFRN
jgi:hypothetical protein